MKNKHQDFFFIIPTHSNPSFRDKVFEAVYSGRGKLYHVHYKQEDGIERVEKIRSATTELSTGFWKKVKINEYQRKLDAPKLNNFFTF